jgi:hypothetical protein
MPRVVFDPSVSAIVVDLLLEAADGRSSLVIPVVLDTGASMTIIATDIIGRFGYDPANPALDRQREDNASSKTNVFFVPIPFSSHVLSGHVECGLQP